VIPGFRGERFEGVSEENTHQPGGGRKTEPPEQLEDRNVRPHGRFFSHWRGWHEDGRLMGWEGEKGDI
jgi:hypothetical protein